VRRLRGLILDSLEFDYLARDLMAGRVSLTRPPIHAAAHPFRPFIRPLGEWTLTDAVRHYRQALASRLEQL
jgi:hypothetical protein